MIGLQFLANMSWQATFLAGVVPFIIPEIGKLIATTAISKPLFLSEKYCLFCIKKELTDEKSANFLSLT